MIVTPISLSVSQPDSAISCLALSGSYGYLSDQSGCWYQSWTMKELNISPLPWAKVSTSFCLSSACRNAWRILSLFR